MATSVRFHENQVIIRTTSLEWGSVDKVLDSGLFRTILSNFLKKLRDNRSEFLSILPKHPKEQEDLTLLCIKKLAKADRDTVLRSNPELKSLLADTYLLDRLVEAFYNYWRGHERYLICLSDPKVGGNGDIDHRPYRTFNDTIEKLNHIVRKISLVSTLSSIGRCLQGALWGRLQKRSVCRYQSSTQN